MEITEAGVTYYELTFPYRPPSKNKYDSLDRMWQSGIKKKWKRDTKLLCMEMHVPKGQKWVSLEATIFFATNRRRDPSNYAGPLWNFVPDGLQECGVLDDDRDGRIEFGENLGIKFEIDKRPILPAKKERTIVRIGVRNA